MWLDFADYSLLKERLLETGGGRTRFLFFNAMWRSIRFHFSFIFEDFRCKVVKINFYLFFVYFWKPCISFMQYKRTIFKQIQLHIFTFSYFLILIWTFLKKQLHFHMNNLKNFFTRTHKHKLYFHVTTYIKFKLFSAIFIFFLHWTFETIILKVVEQLHNN